MSTTISKDELKKLIGEILADGQISSQESDKTVMALTVAITIMNKQEERESELISKYEDKFKEKDSQLLKVMGAFASAVMIQIAVLFGMNQVDPGAVLMIGVSIFIQVMLGILIVWLKDRAPALLPYIKRGTEIIKPLVNPTIQAGLTAIGKLIDATDEKPVAPVTPSTPGEEKRPV